MTNLSELAARIEAAGASEQRALLEETAALLIGSDETCPAGWAELRWCLCLDAEAYESAALMLVPDGAFWSITMRGEKRGGFHACCQLSGGLEWREAATPALALACAALRAKEVSDHG